MEGAWVRGARGLRSAASDGFLRSPLRSAFMLLPALLACVPSVSQVFVVDDDGGPGVDFTDLPAAVAAAGDGDCLLVRAGTYTHFVTSGKGLVLLGDGPATVVSASGVAGRGSRITDVPRTSLVYVDGLTFRGANGSPDFALERLFVGGADTHVTLNDVVLVGTTDGPALAVDGAHVNVLRSSVTGGTGSAPFPSAAPPGQPAITALDGARVHVAASALRGGDGGGTENGGDGGTAVVAEGAGEVWIASSSVAGGDGAFGFGSVGDQGRAIETHGAARVRVNGGGLASVEGGAGGNCPPLPSVVANDGEVVVHGLTVYTGVNPVACSAEIQGSGFTSASPLPRLALDGAGEPTDTATFMLEGPPRAFFLLTWSPSSEASWNDGLLLGHLPAATTLGWGPSAEGSSSAVTGRLSAAGTWSATIPAALLGAVHEPFFAQAAVLRTHDVAFTNLAAGALRPAASSRHVSWAEARHPR